MHFRARQEWLVKRHDTVNNINNVESYYLEIPFKEPVIKGNICIIMSCMGSWRNEKYKAEVISSHQKLYISVLVNYFWVTNL